MKVSRGLNAARPRAASCKSLGPVSIPASAQSIFKQVTRASPKGEPDYAFSSGEVPSWPLASRPTNSSTISRAASSVCCTGGDFIK